MINPYLSLEDLQASLGATTDIAAVDYELAIEAASRWIDARCSDPARGIVRHFWRDASATTRTYQATSPWLVRTGDFDTTTGVTVETEAAGVWTLLASTAWQAEPFVRINDYPYTCITATGYTALFPLGLKPRVRVTARWGWAAIPQAVAQACQILAVSYLLGKDVISNEDGYSMGSKGPQDPEALAEHLLRPYLPDEPQPAKTG
jgi:hypothetical protein